MFLFAEPFTIYTISLLFLLGLCVLEILFFFVGMSLGKLAHFDVDLDLDYDFNVDLDHAQDLNFLNLGKVPFLVILLSFAGLFTFFGMGTHILSNNIFGTYISNFIVAPASIGLSAFFTSSITGLWRKYFPSEETYAVNDKNFIGFKGKVVGNRMDDENPCQVSFVDKFGTKHYMMAKPAIVGDVMYEGDDVFLVKKEASGLYYVLSCMGQEKSMEMNG